MNQCWPDSLTHICGNRREMSQAKYIAKICKNYCHNIVLVASEKLMNTNIKYKWRNEPASGPLYSVVVAYLYKDSPSYMSNTWLSNCSSCILKSKYVRIIVQQMAPPHKYQKIVLPNELTQSKAMRHLKPAGHLARCNQCDEWSVYDFVTVLYKTHCQIHLVKPIGFTAVLYWCPVILSRPVS